MSAKASLIVAATLLVAGLLVAFALGQDGGSEEALPPAPDGSAGALLRSPCPEYRAYLQNRYDAHELRRVEQGRFHFFRTTSELVPPVDWRQDPIRSEVWRARFHGMRWLDPLLYAYSERGDVGALRQARDLALDWVRKNPPEGEDVDPYAWRNKVPGDRAPYLAYIARAAACEGILKRSDAELLLRSLLAHGQFLADPEEYTPNNHGLFMDIGLGTLADYVPFIEESRRWGRLAERRYLDSLERRLTEREKVWQEHSSGYHFLAIRSLQAFLRLTGRDDRHLIRLIDRMKESGAWFVAPDGKVVQLGDTDLVEAPRWARMRAARDRGLFTMREAGYAMVREGDSYLAVTAGFPTTFHKQPDELSFDLHDRGQRIVSNPGKHGYNEGAIRDYVLSARSHSVLTVDGEDFTLESPYGGLTSLLPGLDDEDLAVEPYGSGIVATGRGDGWYAIEGQNPLLAEHEVSHSRLFLYRPGEVLLVLDRVRAEDPHTYQRYFQLGPEIEIERRRDALALRTNGFHGSLADATTGIEVDAPRTAKGETDPIAGFTFPDFRERVPRWTVRYDSHGEDVDHLAVFHLDRQRFEAKVPQSEPALTEIRIEEQGGGERTLQVVRHGDRFGVDYEPSYGGRS